MEKVALSAHKAYYDNPIQLKAGEVFTLSGRSDAWGDNPKHIWLWAIAQDGREGWVPEGFPVDRDGETIAPQDYFARELNVVAGESLDIVREVNGWAWCKNQWDETGWIPQNCFEETV